MRSPKINRIEALGLAFFSLLLTTILVLLQISVIKPSTIANIDWLRYELSGLNPHQSTPTWVEDWLWTHEIPFKYRILGKFPLWAIYQLMALFPGIEKEHAFYYSFIASSFVFLFLTFYALGAFMRALIKEIYVNPGLRMKYLLISVALVLFAISPPVLFHYKYPVHGNPNDLLGYFLILVSLNFMLRRKFVYFCVVSTVAAFCRETTLLIPFIFLFFYAHPLWKKLVIALLPMTSFILFRVLWPGTYEVLYGGRANVSIPLETAVFGLLIFGPLWILGALGYLDLKNQKCTTNSAFVRAYVNSFPLALILTVSIVSWFASVREMRIAYVLFFYFVPFSAIFLHNHGKRILDFAKNKYFIFFLISSLVVIFRIWVWLLPSGVEGYTRLAKLFGTAFTGYWLHPEYNWVNITLIYLFLFIVCASLLFPRVAGLRRSVSSDSAV